jgi:hypothetical protein
MTTQIPYDSAPAQPTPAYPTSPPWAPPAPPSGGPPPEGAPHTQHGQLMVPFPELMHGAGRPAPPSWVPVAAVSVLLAVLGTVGATVACTLFFGPVGGVVLGAGGGALGLFGAAIAARRARRAKRARNPRYPYWLAFGLSLVAATIPCLVAPYAVEPIVQAQVVEPAVVHIVQTDLVHSGKIKTAAGVTVQNATCTPTAPRQANGLREYACVLVLSSGQTGRLLVTADRKGEWTTAKAK